MTAISELLKIQAFSLGTAKLQEQIAERKANLRLYKSYVTMSFDHFKELLKAEAYDIMLHRSISHDFVVDGNNEPVILQLYLYFINDPACQWNLDAGILFGGKLGSGKSLLMMAFLKVANEYSRKVTTMAHSKTLANLIRQSSLEAYARCPLLIDELGREESEVKDWGNVVKPVIDLFSLRYENGARTYATTNFNYSSLEKFYGEFIRSRMEEMMTFVVIPGESRRLKNEVKK